MNDALKKHIDQKAKNGRCGSALSIEAFNPNIDSYYITDSFYNIGVRVFPKTVAQEVCHTINQYLGFKTA